MCSESSPVLSCFFRAARVESVSSFHPLYISPTYQPGNHYYVSHFSCKVTLNVFVCSDVRVYHECTHSLLAANDINNNPQLPNHC